jgi:uncharacterized membrane protein
MDTTKTLIGGIGLGAGLMYILDPVRGKRRRALARDKMKSLVTHMERSAEKASRDIAHRAQGLASEARHVLRHEPVPDDVLEARVRSRLGRLVSHPGAIDATVWDGVVTLTGPVLASEARSLISGVSAVEGVTRVEDRLQRHEQADVPALQGGPSRRPRHRFELLQENWSPAARCLVGTAGAAVAWFGISRRDAEGVALSLLGAGMVARSVANKEFKRIFGIGAGRCAVEARKAINIAAPVDKVFEFWANYENLPRFMAHLKEVRDTGHGRSHWVAAGPAGVSVQWDAEITECVPKQLIAWKSLPGSTVENAGIVRFDSNADGSTRVDIRLCYNPPAGEMGHLIAKLFGSDPNHALNDDLVRLKSLLEVGKTRAHGETVTREELSGIARTLVPGCSTAVS